MGTKRLWAVLAAAFVSLAAGSAVRLDQPSMTSAGDVHNTDTSPQTTPQAFESPIELVRRQNPNIALTGLYPPDRTCGFISGIRSLPLSCDPSRSCVLFTTQPGITHGFVACCSGDCNKSEYSTCIDAAQFSSGRCGLECASDLRTLKCISSTNTFCDTMVFVEGIRDYYCGWSNVSVPQTVQTTFSGQTGRTLSPHLFVRGTHFPLTTTTTTTTATRTTTTTTTATPAHPQGGGGTNAGAIAGGVVGGLAVLAALILGILYLRSHQKQKATAATGALNNSNPGADNPLMRQQEYHVPAVSRFMPAGFYSGHDPNYAQQQSQANQQPYRVKPEEVVLAVPGASELAAAPAYYAQSSSDVPDPHMSLLSSTLSPSSQFGFEGGQPTQSLHDLSLNNAQGQQYDPQYIPVTQGIQSQSPDVFHEVEGVPMDHHRGQISELGQEPQVSQRS